MSSDDLDVIYNYRRGHFTGVSRHDRGWRARMYVAARVASPGGRNPVHSRDRHYVTLGVFRSEVEAAYAVVRWYRSKFGEQWRHVFRYRRCRPWEVVRSGLGYTAWVWWRGVPELVTLADVKACGGWRSDDRRRWVWPSRDAAREAVRLWVTRRVGDAGVEGMLNLYRLGPSRRPWRFQGVCEAAVDHNRLVTV